MISYLPVFTVMGTIFFLSHTTGSELPIAIGDFDKLLHIIAYTTLGLSSLFAVRTTYKQKPLWTSVGVVLFCLLYGMSDEFHQSFVPGRYPSILDVVADASGGVLAALGWAVWHKKKRPAK